MFVEDEIDIVELYKFAFESAGFLIRTVDNGEDALKIIQELIQEKIDFPSAIILDILLPGISGMDVLREIRKHPKINKIPTIMFTNYSSEEFMEEAKRTENTFYILKADVTPDQLVKITKEKIKEAEERYAQ